jgi:WD40 repeat protein
VHPGGEVVATGERGPTPAVHVWDAAGLRALAVLRGLHHRGVGHVAFSPSGRFLATLGDGAHGLLVVYDWKKQGPAAVAKVARSDFFVYSLWWVRGGS